MTEKQLQAAAYLRGLFDGEGSVSLTDPPHRGRVIRIANTDPSIIDYAVACCHLLTIEPRVTWSAPSQRGTRPIATLTIQGRRNTILFCRYVSSSSTIKHAKLRDLRRSYRAGTRYKRYRYHRYKSVTFRQRIVTLYAQGMTAREIGQRLKCTGATVTRVLRMENIPIRAYTPQEMSRLSRHRTMWGPHHYTCEGCSETVRPHKALGYCTRCYARKLHGLPLPPPSAPYRPR